MSIGNIIFNKVVPNTLIFFGISRNSWNFKKISVLIHSLIMIPVKKIKGRHRTTSFVQKQYDQISGSYIQDNYYKDKKRFSVVNGNIMEISSIKNMKLIREEIRLILNAYNFNNILEVGVGELTTLEDIFSFKNCEIDCYGIDLSLNRLSHGISEFKKKYKKIPYVAKSNAKELPFPDNSFDLVITRHTLEQIPKDYKIAIDEILRVSKKYIILFEPSFELGGFIQKLKMINSDYVRGIPKYLSTKHNLNIHDAYLMKNSANPLNHTACTKIAIKKNINMNNDNKVIPFVCPITKEVLKLQDNFFYAVSSKIAYPIINNIPILDKEHSFKLTKI